MTSTALVTGASRGLGAAIARKLAPDHHLYLGGRSLDSLAAISSELPGSTPWPVDLLDHDAVRASVQHIDSLDVLVHNAGVAALGTVEESSVDDWRSQYESNVLAVVSLTQALLPALRRAGGHVVLINSGAGLRVNPGWGGYAASKFALRAFGDALRAEETSCGSPPSTRVVSTPTCSARSSAMKETSTTARSSCKPTPSLWRCAMPSTPRPTPIRPR